MKKVRKFLIQLLFIYFFKKVFILFEDPDCCVQTMNDTYRVSQKSAPEACCYSELLERVFGRHPLHHE